MSQDAAILMNLNLFLLFLKTKSKPTEIPWKKYPKTLTKKSMTETTRERLLGKKQKSKPTNQLKPPKVYI